MSSCKFSLTLAMMLMLAAATGARADGFIVVPPHRPSRPQIRNVPLAVKYHHVDVKIRDQVAITEIDQVFVNPNGWQLEGTYIFPLPEGASISKFSMFIDGKEVKAELLERDKARAIYEGIVRRMQDPALLEYIGTRMFQARIFPIPAHGEKRLKLTYSQVLKGTAGLVEYLYPLNTEKFSSRPLESCSVNVSISGKRSVRNVYSPTHRIEIVRKSDTEVRASWEAKGVKPDTDFRLYFSQDAKDFALNLITHKPSGEDGYYMLLLSPGDDRKQTVIAKDVVFVQDTSGSMQDDDKMEQAKKALSFCLKSLRKGDRFGLVTFATEARVFRDSLVEVNAENVASAVSHVNGLSPIGGTNIDEALARACAMNTDMTRPFIIVFFTDGRPTIGERDAKRLAENVRKRAKKNVRLFTFGVGYDVNAPLLDRLAGDNRGTTEYVAPKEDLEVKVGSFFTKIASPVLADVSVSIDGIKTSDVYPKQLPDLFKGSQLIVLGRWSGEPGSKTVRLKGVINGKPREIVHEIKFDGGAESNTFLPRLWAIRKVGYLLRQMRTHGATSEVKNEIVRLARRHGIVTPYTSFLVLEDEKLLGRDAPRTPSRRAFDQGAGGGGWRREGGESDGDDALRTAEDLMRALSGSARGKISVDASKDIGRMLRDATLETSERKRQNERESIRHVGAKTFYFDVATKTWIDADVDMKATRTKVKSMSDAYFALVAKHTGLGKYLALGKRVVVQIGKTVYEIE